MRICSYSSLGYEGHLIEVEIDIRRGIPGMDIIGLPDSSIKEAKDRIRVAIKNSGFTFPPHRIVVNLAPAYIKKIGTAFDLAIALGILIHSQQLTAIDNRILVLGELSLSGDITKIQAMFSALLSAQKNSIPYCFIPESNLKEASFFKDLKIIPLSNLKQLKNVVNNIAQYQYQFDDFRLKLSQKKIFDPDFSQIKGQEYLKRALLVALAGRHNAILAGPPGVGKTLSLSCLSQILSPLSEEEFIETNCIWSVSGKLNTQTPFLINRPLRQPHHSSSSEGIIGGGHYVKPGEISLAHNGVLFLDEVLEFKKNILQNLREPMEDRCINLSRAGQTYQFPANFQLFLSSNLCPCANLGKVDALCSCSIHDIQRYWKKLGGALLDRMDVRVKVLPVDIATLMDGQIDTNSHVMYEKLILAYERQKIRYQGEKFRYNAELSPDKIKIYCPLSSKLHVLLVNILDKLNFSSRAIHSILKLARTISDLENHDNIEQKDLLEAIQHRRYLEDIYSL